MKLNMFIINFTISKRFEDLNNKIILMKNILNLFILIFVEILFSIFIDRIPIKILIF
jgi:hypothetical protein